MSKFDTTTLQKELESLPAALRAAFALLAAERLYPALVAYSRETNGNEAETTRSGLDKAWQFLLSGKRSESTLQKHADAIYDLRPETEDNPSNISSYALDASAAAWEALLCVMTGESSRAVAAANIAYESTLLQAEEAEDFSPQVPADQAAISVRKHVVTELNNQTEQLTFAIKHRESPMEAVALLRSKFGYPSSSNIGLK